MKRVIVSSTRRGTRRPIRAAENTEDTRVRDLSDELKDDFDYVLDGFDKLNRDGLTNEALEIMNNLSSAINHAIQDSADLISE